MKDLFGEEIVERTTKDWTGTSKSMFKMLGASNHCKTHARQCDDYYATCPQATEWLCKLEKFDGPILEPACGEGHISKVLKAHGYDVVSRDLVDRGYGDVANFLSPELKEWGGDIVTNPPFKYAQEFCEKALEIIPDGISISYKVNKRQSTFRSMRMERQVKQTGYEFWLPDGHGGHITSHDGDKQKPRYTDRQRVGGNGFGCGTNNVSFTITVRDRHMVGVFR